MNSNWFPRLLDAIREDGRSMRKLSIDAGLGSNFVQQMVTNGKQPGAENLQRLLDALGYSKMIYILTGISFSEADAASVRCLLDLPPETRRKATELFRTIAQEGDA